MPQEKKDKKFAFLPDGKLEKISFFITVLLSLVLIATAICFIVSCIAIYTSDSETPFSRETVANHLKKVAPISFISIGIAILGGILSLFTKKVKTKKIPIRKKTLLGIFKKKLEEFSTSDEYITLEKAETKKRTSHLTISKSYCIIISLFSDGINHERSPICRKRKKIKNSLFFPMASLKK